MKKSFILLMTVALTLQLTPVSAEEIQIIGQSKEQEISVEESTDLEDYASEIDDMRLSQNDGLELRQEHIEISLYLEQFGQLIKKFGKTLTEDWQSYEIDQFYLEWTYTWFSIKNEGADYVKLYGYSLGDSAAQMEKTLKKGGWVNYYSDSHEKSYIALLNGKRYLIALYIDENGNIISWYLNNWPEGQGMAEAFSKLRGDIPNTGILTSDPDPIERTVGNVTFFWESSYDKDRGVSGNIYIRRDGRTTLFAAETNLSPYIATDGEEVFYSKCDADSGITVFRKGISDEAGQVVFHSEESNNFSLVGYYNSTIYYIKGLDPGNFCGYELTTQNQSELVGNVTKAKQNNQYFYLEPYCGDAGSASVLQVYNAAHSETTLISEHVCKIAPLEIIDGFIYYVEYSDEEDFHIFPAEVRVKRCKEDGSEEKTLIDDLEITSVRSITRDSIFYRDKNGEDQVKRFE